MGRLRLKAEGAKSTLHMAMTNLGNQQLAINNRLITDNMALVNLRPNTELLRRFELFMLSESQSPPPSRASRVEELPESSSESGDNNMDITARHKHESNFLSSISGDKQRGSTGETPLPGQKRQEATSTSISHTSRHTTYEQERNFLQFQNILPIGKSKCSPDFRCRCHFSQGRFQSPRWFQPLLGSWLVSYNSVSNFGRRICNWRECNSGDDSYIRVEYRLPKRIMAGLLYIQASYGSTTSLDLSLRPSRVLVYHDVWEEIRKGGTFEKFSQQGVRFFPDDQGEDNRGLLEYAIINGAYDSVEYLLFMWKDLLPKQGLPSTVAVAANVRKHDNLSDREVHLLQQARSWANDGFDLRSTKVHRAVRLEDGLPRALEEEPWAIGQYNEQGTTPLHMVVQQNWVRGLEQLIAAKSDINEKDWRGRTALMLAAVHGHILCMEVLLRANCRVDQQDDSGMTALHHATLGGSAPAVALLLVAGASPTKREKWGQTPLHYMAYMVDQKAADEILRLLLVKGDDLDVADAFGHTPAMVVLILGNVPPLRSLIDAGASLHFVDGYSQNLLHYVARWCTVDAMHYLDSLELGGINTDMRNSIGHTPWDDACYYRDDAGNFEGARQISPEHEDAFLVLYNNMLCRNLQDEINTLERLLRAAAEHDMATSSMNLNTLIKQKEDWKEPDLAAWNRGINSLIRGGRWESAASALEDTLEELKTKKLSLPRKFDDPETSSDEESVGTEEAESECNSEPPVTTQTSWP
ncbi:ankyrin repeat-containing domain protein [Ilyonectria robusta]|uniref:ankyrin repeat-containing domain protein n=1 Tax=Ilyonectria robusta TaxID=1079257 RepID=UPI001E8CC61F|nr:ankyrin repeat-containing domain protein [Ilyonectria robusta]KAH8666086.1 ankyrin repeat-containing domain protein [Ilyonectria robusta]